MEQILQISGTVTCKGRQGRSTFVERAGLPVVLGLALALALLGLTSCGDSTSASNRPVSSSTSGTRSNDTSPARSSNSISVVKGTLVEFIDGNGDLWHWKVKVDEVISGKGIQTGDVVRVSDHAGTHAILKREQGTLTLRPVDPLQPARGWRVQAAQY